MLMKIQGLLQIKQEMVLKYFFHIHNQTKKNKKKLFLLCKPPLSSNNKYQIIMACKNSFQFHYTSNVREAKFYKNSNFYIYMKKNYSDISNFST